MKYTITKVKHSKDIGKGGHVKITVDDHSDAIRVYFVPDKSEPAIAQAELICAIPKMIELIRNYDEKKAKEFLGYYDLH